VASGSIASLQLGPDSYKWGPIGLNNSSGAASRPAIWQLAIAIRAIGTRNSRWIGQLAIHPIQFAQFNEGNSLVGFTVLAHGSPERRRRGRKLIQLGRKIPKLTPFLTVWDPLAVWLWPRRGLSALLFFFAPVMQITCGRREPRVLYVGACHAWGELRCKALIPLLPKFPRL
jgi:hypothetical protein